MFFGAIDAPKNWSHQWSGYVRSFHVHVDHYPIAWQAIVCHNRLAILITALTVICDRDDDSIAIVAAVAGKRVGSHADDVVLLVG
jgi:hypothetical protein